MTTYHGDRARRLLIAELSTVPRQVAIWGGRNTSPESRDKSTPSTRDGALRFSVSAIFDISFSIFAQKYSDFGVRCDFCSIWFWAKIKSGFRIWSLARWFVSFFRFFCGKYARQRPRPRTSSPILLAVFCYFYTVFFKRTVLQLLMHSSAILHTLCSCNSYLIQIYIWTKTNHIICHVVGTLCLSMR